MTKVVLYSGGLDSFCLANAVQPDVLVYFDIGLPEQQYEKEAITRMSRDGLLAAPVIFDNRFHLAEYKLPNEVMPFRNLYFIIAGFSYGDKLYLGKTASSRNLDKDPTFVAKALAVCKYVAQNPKNNPPGLTVDNMEVLLPFDKKTKTMFLHDYLNGGGKLEHVLRTRSCYRPLGKECGACQSCIRKSIALVNNGVNIKGMFDLDPTLNYVRQYDEVVRIGNKLVVEEVYSALLMTGQRDSTMYGLI